MERVQLAMEVQDLGAAVEFYNETFSALPSTHLPGYAVYEMTQPPLLLVLVATPDRREPHPGACSSVVNATNCCSVIHYESSDHQDSPACHETEPLVSAV